MAVETQRKSLTWTLLLMVLLTTQLRESEAGVNFKLKKLLKKILLLRALSPKKDIAIIPLPIPLGLVEMLLKKGKMEMEMPKMPEMPMPMPMPMHMMPYPMMGGEMMMMKPPAEEMKMPSGGGYGKM
ncbi:uncharacterized protein LOC129975250 [Argiope bruennichi]|uniref:Uncharacterized protein n=1 Tax=Argiope bruennichi TaxID=94029 RepID=A0A8T0EPU6_ARGBR|nr:uncharacterized protein LOC129975250 [Argiope bruennichi]KAF8777757.1 hypothetical protein HNY73_014571 [Argiope bruennichi]